MRLFDDDKIGVYLDDYGPRLEKTKDGKEVKMIDLTLRVQPFPADLAGSLDPDVRALLFTMNDATPKSKIKAMEFKLSVPNQVMTVFLLPEAPSASIAFFDVEISSPRARTEKGVDGFGFVFYASVGPVGPTELEYVQNWYTQQRFITFQPQAPALDFAGASGEEVDLPRQPRRHNKTGPGPVAVGDELRPGVHAEH